MTGLAAEPTSEVVSVENTGALRDVAHGKGRFSQQTPGQVEPGSREHSSRGEAGFSAKSTVQNIGVEVQGPGDGAGGERVEVAVRQNAFDPLRPGSRAWGIAAGQGFEAGEDVQDSRGDFQPIPRG